MSLSVVYERVTGEQLRDRAAETGQRFFYIRACPVCGQTFSFQVTEEAIFRNPSPECVQGRATRTATWDDIAEALNRQAETASTEETDGANQDTLI